MSLHIFLEKAPKIFIKSLISEWILDNDLAKFQISITSRKTLIFDTIFCKHINNQNKIF